MQAIAERGHAAMLWLLGLGLLAAWAMVDRPPPVIETALGVVESALAYPRLLGLSGDPLAKLPPAAKTPLVQYRHEFLRPAFEYDSSLLPAKRGALENVTVDAVLMLTREVLSAADESEVPLERREYLLASLRSDILRLETWRHKSGLGTTASLQDVQTELGSRIQVPGTEQTVAAQDCLTFVGLAIVGLQLYLTSLLATLATVSGEQDSADRSWVVLHRAPLGPLLSLIWLALPGLVWIFGQVVDPLGRRETVSSLAWLLGAAIVVATSFALWQVRRARCRHLNTSAAVPDMRSIAVRRRAA